MSKTIQRKKEMKQMPNTKQKATPLLGLPDTATIELLGEPQLAEFTTLEEYLKKFWIWLEGQLVIKTRNRPDPNDYDTPSREWSAVLDEYWKWNKNHPATKRAARLYQSFIRIDDIVDDAAGIICPVCEKSAANNLVFICHPYITMERAVMFAKLRRGVMIEKGNNDEETPEYVI